MRTNSRLNAMFLSVAAFGLMLSASGRVEADVIAAPYVLNYTLTNLGAPVDVPGLFGGITFKAGDTNTLLIGGDANTAAGAIYSVGVLRDINGHITGFSGPATLFALAPNIDGGLAYGPGGVLFYTAYPTNQLGQIKDGSSSPDKVVNLTDAGLTGSVGGLQFVPAGLPGAGTLKLLSYGAGQLYDAVLASDGSGTYDVTSTTYQVDVGAPEGLIYVAGGNPDFPTNSALIANYALGKILAYSIDGNGNPIIASEQDFITGLSGAEGALVDPVTNDFLFSTFGGGGHVVVVSGFTTAIPEPSSLVLLGLTGVGSLALVTWRRRKGAGPAVQSCA